MMALPTTFIDFKGKVVLPTDAHLAHRSQFDRPEMTLPQLSSCLQCREIMLPAMRAA